MNGYKKGENMPQYEIINGKGIIKEYDNEGELIFEGEYLNGERNGRGKEYSNDGELIFDGVYLNGKRNGEGKEYSNDDEGELIFEGKYLNGKKMEKEKNIIIMVN